MRFRCPCGEIIADTTDGLPNKAVFRPDEDDTAYQEYLDAEARRLAKAGPEVQGDDAFFAFDANHFEESMYECARCGRLFLPSRTSPRLLGYLPEADERGVLRSRQRKD